MIVRLLDERLYEADMAASAQIYSENRDENVNVRLGVSGRSGSTARTNEDQWQPQVVSGMARADCSRA